MRKTPALAALVVTLSLALGACGADGTQNNDADVAFATEMIPHHTQAVEMVDLAEGRPLDPAVQQLADDIKAAQDPEIETMSGWLEDWDEPVPDTSGGMGDMQMDSSMPGMMSADDMTSLADAPDAEFQQLWLEMMVEHHTGAVEMAKTEETDGEYEPAIELARDIQESQSTEIETMQGLLAG